MDKVLYSISEVSKILGCNRNKVYELLNAGELPYIQLGTKKVLHETLMDYLKGKEIYD